MSHTADVAIIGAGGFGREVLEYCQDAQNAGWPFRVVGFIDDGPDALKMFTVSVGVLGNLTEIGKLSVENFIIAIGDPSARRKICELIGSVDGSLVSIIHPTAYVSSTARVEAGAVLCPFSMVGSGAVVEQNVAVNVYGSVGHDANIGEHCVLSPYTAITGAVYLGDESFLGAHSTIAPGVSVGRRSKINAGSVVTRNAEPGSLLVGNPASGRVMFSLTDRQSDGS